MEAVPTLQENVFPTTLPYGFQNILLATRADPDLARVRMAKTAIEEIRAVLRAFTDAAAARDLVGALHLDWTYEDHALDALDAYCDRLLAGQKRRIDYRSAYIFAVFLERQIDYLRQTAKEIDEDYGK